jgi:plastocyanin
MKTATTAALTLVRATGLIQIVTGVLFWTGNALALIPAHMLSGLVLVLALWALALLGARAGVSPGFVALAVLWGLLVVGLGLTQTQLLPGDFHWVIQVLHLLIGLAAMGLAQNLATRIRRGAMSARPAVALTSALGTALTAALALLAAACGAAQPAVAVAAPGAGGAHQVTVTASEMAFSPATVEVRAGEAVKVTLVNRGLLDHNWQVRLGGETVTVEARPRQSASTTFTAPAPGTYEVICSLPGHAQAGMTGTLVAR